MTEAKYKVGDFLERPGVRDVNKKAVFNLTELQVWALEVVKVLPKNNNDDEYEYRVMNYQIMGEMNLKESQLVPWQGDDETLQSQKDEVKDMETLLKLAAKAGKKGTSS